MSATTTYKFDCFVYCSGALRYNFADGYTDGTTNGYHYYIRDHQGNNRVVAKYDGMIEQTTQNYFGSDIGKGQLDSIDDQYSIDLGYYGGQKHKAIYAMSFTYKLAKKSMKYSNKYIIRGLILLVFPILAYSCDNGCKQKTTFADILKSDSVELNNIIETLRNSNIDRIGILSRYENYEHSDKGLRFGFFLVHIEDSTAFDIGGFAEGDNIVIKNHHDAIPDNTLLDTLDMINDFKETLRSCRKIARGYYLVMLDARTILYENPLLSSEVVNNYVEVLLYYKKEHYLVIYAKEDKINAILNDRKKHQYNDLDIENRCQRLYGDVYLVGFSSQEYFFKNR